MKLEEKDLHDFLDFRGLTVEEKTELFASLRDFLDTQIPKADIAFPVADSPHFHSPYYVPDQEAMEDFISLASIKLGETLMLWATQLKKAEAEAKELQSKITFSVNEENKQGENPK